jgi:hypothetical protein
MFAMLRKTVLAVAVAFASFACGGDSDVSSNPTSPDAAGSLNIRITDSPFGAAKAVLVTFSEVAVQRGSDWVRLPFPDGSTNSWMCDLKKLENNAQDLIASGAPAQGDYTWVRVVVSSARVYLQNSAQSPTPCGKTITAPAGESYAMTIQNSEGKDNGTFPVRGTGATNVLIDFDGESSITEPSTNNYVLNPVVRVIGVQ